jgi:hypothetical protein
LGLQQVKSIAKNLFLSFPITGHRYRRNKQMVKSHGWTRIVTLSEKKFLFKEYIAILQLQQAIPAQAISIAILEKSSFFVR